MVRITAESDWLWLWPETAFEMRMELEVVDRVLAVPFDEADRDDAFAQHTLDADRDLALVRRAHGDAAAVGLEHGGVVDLDAEVLGERRLPVRVHGAHVQKRVAPRHRFDNVLGAPAVRILALEEIGELHGSGDGVDHFQRPLRRREHLLARQIDVRVVQRQGEIGEHGDRDDRDDDGGGIDLRERARQPGLERQAQGEPEQHDQRAEPAGEPDQIRELDLGHVQRLASARTQSSRPSRIKVAKKPRSDRYRAPVASGVKCASSDRLITTAS